MSLRKSDLVTRRRLTSQQGQRLLARHHQSQSSQAEFAARHGLGLSTLGNWLRQERNGKAAPVAFEEVVLPGATSRWVVELVSPRGWTVRLAQIPQDVEGLESLLDVLPC